MGEIDHYIRYKCHYKFPNIDPARKFEADVGIESPEALDVLLSDMKAFFGMIAENSCLGMVSEMEFSDGDVITVDVFNNEIEYTFDVIVSRVWDANVI